MLFSSAVESIGSKNTRRTLILKACAGAWFLAAMAMGLSRLTVENLRPIDFDTLGYVPVLLEGRVPQFWQHAGLGFAYIPYLVLHAGGAATLAALQINFALFFVLNAILYAAIAFFLFRRGDAALFFGGLYCVFPAHQFLLASLEDNIPVHGFILAPLALLAFAYRRPAAHGEKHRRFVVNFTIALGAAMGIAFLMATSFVLWIPFFVGLWLLIVRRGDSIAGILKLAFQGAMSCLASFAVMSGLADVLTGSEIGAAAKMQLSILEHYRTSLDPAAFRVADPGWHQLRSPGIRERFFLASTAEALFGFFQNTGTELFRAPHKGYPPAIAFFAVHLSGFGFMAWNRIKHRANSHAGLSAATGLALLLHFGFVFFYADRAYFERHDFYLLLLPFLIFVFHQVPRPSARLIGVSLMLAALLCGIWFWFTSPRESSLLYHMTAQIENGRSIYYASRKEMLNQSHALTARLAGFQEVRVLKSGDLPTSPTRDESSWPRKSREALIGFRAGKFALSPVVKKRLGRGIGRN